MEWITLTFNFMFSTEANVLENTLYPTIIFSLSSACFGVLVVILDAVLVTSQKTNSLLKLSYSGLLKTGLMIILWGLGSGIGSLIASSFGILELNRAASITAGVMWPLLLPRLLTTLQNDISNEKITAEVES